MTDGKLIHRLGAKLSDLLSDEQNAKAGSNGANGHGGGDDDHDESLSREVHQEEFEAHLRTLLKQETKPLAGRLNFIGLSKIKEKLGDRWEKLSARADDITRKAIERRLTNVDVYTRYKELHYLIVFAQLSPEQAQLKCALIAEEITKRLLGEDIAPELLEVKTMLSALDGKFEFENVPDIETLASRIGDAPATAETSKNPDDDWWNDEETTDPLADVQLVYRPMWDVKRNAVTTYVCVPARPGAGGRLQVGESEIPRLEEPEVSQRLDLMIQKRVIGDLRKLVESGKQQLLCLPVHFETLASNQRRLAYLDRCRRGVPPHGVKLLVFELMGIPEGIPQNRLLELATALRRFSRGVLLRTKVSETVFRPPNETGIAAIGFEHFAAFGIAESRQIAEMERFASAAKKAALATYVHGLRTISLTTAAIAAGFDFVDGDVVTSVVDTPSGAYSFQMQDLFTARFRAGGPVAVA